MPIEEPRYRQILNVLSHRVETGQYPLEERLPTESDLCDEFGASRFTVREALRRLVDDGMVQRRKGSGSILVATKPAARYVHSLSSLADLSQFAFNTHYDLLKRERVRISADRAGKIGAKRGSTWWCVRGIRRGRPGGSLLCYVHSYIPLRLSRYVGHLDAQIVPFHAYLSRCADEAIVEVEQELYGEPMNRDVAAHLRQKPGTIGLCALRRYISRKGTIIASYNWHVAQDFHYRMKLSRDG